MNSPVFFTISDLYKEYPTLQDRGWTAEDLRGWVEQDIIIGRYDDSKGYDGDLEVEKESIERFIAYHNDHLSDRVNATKKDIERGKKTND